MNHPPSEYALAALDKCGVALAELEARCCEPGRSPSMAALANTLDTARTRIQELSGDPDPTSAVDALEDAGAQVGRLQVGCCAPDRLPLYARILQELTRTQRIITGTHVHGDD